MPREIVHWNVLHEALNRFSKQYPDAATTEILQHFESAAVFGACAHDAPYYFRAKNVPFEEVAHYLHGKDGEDTYAPIIRALSAAFYVEDDIERQILFSFILGMMSHVAVDVTFHPVVTFYSGNYWHPDPVARKGYQTLHRK